MHGYWLYSFCDRVANVGKVRKFHAEIKNLTKEVSSDTVVIGELDVSRKCGPRQSQSNILALQVFRDIEEILEGKFRCKK